MSEAHTDSNEKAIRFSVKRQDKPDSDPYWQDFDVPWRPNMNVISALQAIASKPVTVHGENTQPVAWDCSCLEEVCGACTMVINGKVRQSCSALVDEVAAQAEGGPVTLEPMSKFPVVRDLFVDRQRMFDNLKAIEGWVPIDSTAALGPGPTESPESQELRYDLSRCMTCGCCLEACPQFTKENNFVGAQVIGQALYFNEHETSKTRKAFRLDVMMEPGGISDCGNAQNCVKVCPKDIPLTEAIGKIGRQATVHGIKKFFTGKK